MNLFSTTRGSRWAKLLPVALLLGVALPSIGCKSRPGLNPPKVSKRQVPKQDPRPQLVEDEFGVIGGPVDESEFDFEPEIAETSATLEVVNIPAVPKEIAVSLRPFMDSRRTRLQGIGVDGGYVVGVTRLGQAAQGYRINTPMGELRQVTFSDEPVNQVSSVPGVGGAFALRTDTGGNEDFQIFKIDKDRSSLLITDGASRHGSFVWSPKDATIAFAGNGRNGTDMDLYVATLGDAPSMRMLAERQGSWTPVEWSRDGTQLLAREYIAYNHSAIHLVDTATGTSEALFEATPGIAYMKAKYGPDGVVYVTSNRDGEFMSLHRVVLEDRSSTNLTGDIAHDVVELTYNHPSNQISYTTNVGGRSELFVLDVSSGERRDIELPPGIVSGLRFARQGKVLAFTLDRATTTGDIYTYDLEANALTRWSNSEAADLSARNFVEPVPITYPSFDDLPIAAWAYVPPTDGPHPVLLWIHGGPEDEYQPSFNPFIQYLVIELGIAVIAPNIRGSEGYGRTFVSLDDGMKREDSVKDIGALLDWIDMREDLDAERVGIFGASYGGYVVLASMIRYPERFAAGCDMVGISNFVTFLENTREYRVNQRRAEYGDERDPEMREFLDGISPTTNAEKIVRPLFVVHGANDPRVPVDEARQIFEAVQENGAEAWLMVAHDEGHGFSKRVNRDAFYGALATFLQRHLVLAAHQPDEGEP